MYKNIIFDFGNVLAEFHPEKLTRACVSDEQSIKPIIDVVFDRIYWDRLDEGIITDDEVKKEMSERLPASLHEYAFSVYDNWVKNLIPIKGMSELVKDLKVAGKNIYLISNISIGFTKSYHSVPWITELFANFDGLIFSGLLHLTKPGKEIFEHLLTNYCLDKTECIFIDDSKINIKGAKTAGISGYLFDGDSKKLRDFLKI